MSDLQLVLFHEPSKTDLQPSMTYTQGFTREAGKVLDTHPVLGRTLRITVILPCDHVIPSSGMIDSGLQGTIGFAQIVHGPVRRSCHHLDAPTALIKSDTSVVPHAPTSMSLLYLTMLCPQTRKTLGGP